MELKDKTLTLLEDGESEVLRKIIHEVEESVIGTALVYFRGNITKTALVLGLNRTTLRVKIKKINERSKERRLREKL